MVSDLIGTAGQDCSLYLRMQPRSWAFGILEVEQGMVTLGVKAGGRHGFKHVQEWNVVPGVYLG